MSKITYVFTSSRSNRIDSKDYADEFFYGLRSLKNKHNINIIEFQPIGKFARKVEYVISRLFSLPLYMFSLYSQKNRKIIKNTDYLFLVSESAGFAALPLLIFFKKKYKIKTSMFVMGLYSKKINYKFLKLFHNFFILLLEKYVENIYFLGKSELSKAQKTNPKNAKKMHFLPFYIDTNFWSQKQLNLQDKNSILFIGNDGNRDYEILVEIAKKMNDKKFIFVSNNNVLINSNLPNVTYLKGSWNDTSLTDIDIRNIYNISRLTILPLKNSFQPSGQSVTLQSMSMGNPVIISDTPGFWDSNNFRDGENIFFVKEPNINLWVDKINEIYDDFDLLNKISVNGTELVNKNYSVEILNLFLENKVS